MSKIPRLPVLIATVASLVLCGSAQAAIVTIGSVASGTPLSVNAGGPITDVQTTLPEAGANVVSPINGAIVHWRLAGFEGGPFRLRVFTRSDTDSYTGAGTSTPEAGLTGKAETFNTDLPIKAGQAIGFEDNSPSDKLGIFQVPGSAYVDFPPLAEGATMIDGSPEFGDEFALRAEVQPAPTLTALGSSSGPASGGTSVTIAGTDLEGATAVKFGAAAASSFILNSEGQITAISPAAPTGPVMVSVTTPAGTATSSQQFTYTPPAPAPTCVVPKLIGKKLKAARKALNKADCKLGKAKGNKVKGTKVKKQNPKPGKVLAPGSKVSIKLS